MNQNNKDRVKDFFRKEGFYFVLILCLCVVAIAANFAIGNNDNEANNEETQDNEFTLNIDDESNELGDISDVEMQNADRAEEESNLNLAEAPDELVETSDELAEDSEEVTETPDELEEVAETSATVVEVVFQLPLEGEVARSYANQMIKVSGDEDGSTHTSRGGIDITAAEGSVVKVAADGIVEEIANTPKEGNYVVIAHQNGMKTIYCNLNENISVSEGDSITVGTELGTVGNSSLIFTSDICGDVLNLQIEDSNGDQINPSEYFNF